MKNVKVGVNVYVRYGLTDISNGLHPDDGGGHTGTVVERLKPPAAMSGTVVVRLKGKRRRITVHECWLEPHLNG